MLLHVRHHVDGVLPVTSRTDRFHPPIHPHDDIPTAQQKAERKQPRSECAVAEGEQRLRVWRLE